MAKNEAFEVLLERKLILKNQETRSRSELKVRIGVPRWTKRGREAACPVAIEGLVGRVEDIRGVDPMQAVELAIAFVNSLLSSLPPTKKVQWPSGEPYKQLD